jgi:hypothetical protein
MADLIPKNWVYQVTIKGDGIPIISKKDEPLQKEISPNDTARDRLINMIEEGSYVEYKSGSESIYFIYKENPNMIDFNDYYEDGTIYTQSPSRPGVTVTNQGDPSTFNQDLGGGSRRRRRPSRKYKKSKRVLRRKSRSTRRR